MTLDELLTRDPMADPWELVGEDFVSQSVPLKRRGFDFKFRRRWFQLRNQLTFSLYIHPKFAGRKVRFVDIGIFEAMQEVWLLQNVLTHPESRVIGIDPWAATPKLDEQFMEECFQNAKHNLRQLGVDQKWHLVRGYSRYILQRMKCWPDKHANDKERCTIMPPLDAGSFDLAIIDGDHDAEPCKRDAELCLPLMKRGGWMLFDDVRNRIPKKDHVAHGVQQFLEQHGDRVKLIWRHKFMDCYEVL